MSRGIGEGKVHADSPAACSRLNEVNGVREELRQARRAIAVLALAAIFPLAGCATSGETVQRVSGDVITREHLADLGNLSVYDALIRMKPSWVRSPRFASMRVYLDGISQGGRAALRGIEVRSVEEIRFLDQREATLQFGTGHGGGALVIRTQR